MGPLEAALNAAKGGFAENMQKAVAWYRRAGANVKSKFSKDFLEDPLIGVKKVNRLGEVYVGKMCLFYYDPKHKETLPYYDRFPMIFPIEWYKDGSMLGINLHYLEPRLRAKLLDTLMNDKLNAKKDRLIITYKILKSAGQTAAFEPCVKKYLLKHVRSKFMVVPQDQWANVIWLPTERFEKASASKVWADSAKKINNRKQGRK